MPFDRTAEKPPPPSELEAAAGRRRSAERMDLIRNGGIGRAGRCCPAGRPGSGAAARAKAREEATTYVVEQLRQDAAGPRRRSRPRSSRARAPPALQRAERDADGRDARRARRPGRAPARGGRRAAARLAGGAALMSHDHRRRMGVRKAAILLIQLGQEQAAPVLSHLPEAEVEAISAEIARLDGDRAPTRPSRCSSEFRDLLTARAHVAAGRPGLRPAAARAVARRRPGRRDHRAAQRRRGADAVPVPAPRRPAPAALLHRRRAPADHRAGARAHDRRQGVAACCPGSPPSQQAEVAHRIAVMDRTSPEIIRAVEATLERKLSSVLQPAEHVPRRRRRPAGRHHQPLRPRHRAPDPRGPRVPRRRARRGGPEPDVHVRGHRPARRPRRCSWCCARSTTPSLALALKGVSERSATRSPRNLSERAAENLSRRSSCSARSAWPRSRRPSRAIIRAIRQLEEQGQIMVRRGSDDEFVV